MRKRVRDCCGLRLPGGVIGGTLVANAGPSITSPEAFTLVGGSHRIYAEDQGKRGPSPGDVLVFTLQLTDESSANVGKGRGRCTVHAGRWEICTYAWDIADRGESSQERSTSRCLMGGRLTFNLSP
jgi:hypothetical protein